MDHSKTRPIVKIIIFLILILMSWYLSQYFKIDIEQIRQRVFQFPLGLSGLIFVVVYVSLTSLIWFGPHDVLRIAAAIFFGASISTAFIWVGEVLNSFAMFHLSRFFGREYVENRLRIKSNKLDQVAQDHSTLAIVAWKINPFIPGRLTDLGYGLTNISFRRFVVPASLANLPRIYWQQYILADLGLNFVKDFSGTVQYIQENVFFAKYTLVYLSAVLVISVLAGRKKHKQKNRK
ncbi:MAG: VTT domain-containing protein [Candidatus Omnitrophica bacterium]|nr:VTT domain-containing protein [Candidatus Omnitrophota bacterium]